MGATHKNSILRSLDLDAAMVESLPEAVWSELIGFIEYDNQLVRESSKIGLDSDAFYGGGLDSGPAREAAVLRARSDWPAR